MNDILRFLSLQLMDFKSFLCAQAVLKNIATFIYKIESNDA
jgi:hypothetical protein